jgi:surface antigen
MSIHTFHSKKRAHTRHATATGVRTPSATIVVLAALGIAALPASPAGAAYGASYHRAQQTRKPHRQALHGSLSQAHVKIVTILLQGGKGGGGDPGDDYPAKWRDAPMDSELDQWREYNRECTSFVAWALYSRNGFNMPFHDNANGWGPDAIKRGYAVNGTPAVGSVAWSDAGTYGHVAYVVSVGGGDVTVEEYNEHYNGTYDKRTVAAGAFTGYIHFKDQPAEYAAPAPPPSTSPTLQGSSPVLQGGSGSPLQPAPSEPGSGTGTPAPPAPPPPPPTYAETVGGVTDTWTNYTNAGGTEGPSIPSGETVQIACKIVGFAVADGNTWWYRIASGPWNEAFYASADAFYNDGRTSGSLVNTPFVDGAVPNC